MSLGASFKLNFGAQSMMAGSPGCIILHNIGTGNQEKKRRNPPFVKSCAFLDDSVDDFQMSQFAPQRHEEPRAQLY